MKKCLLLALAFLPIFAYTQNAPEKNADSVKRLSRLGRTEYELGLVWGNPLREATVSGQLFGGLRKDHVKYFPKYWSGSLYEVDNLRLYVGFYAGKAIAIGFYHCSGSLSFKDAEKIAQTLTKSRFGARPTDTSGYFSVYSNGAQQYLLQKGDMYVVIDMRMVKEQAENPNPKVTTDNL